MDKKKPSKNNWPYIKLPNEPVEIKPSTIILVVLFLNFAIVALYLNQTDIVETIIAGLIGYISGRTLQEPTE
jgi:4-hydroxybenzoate polyprenyltransferase